MRLLLVGLGRIAWRGFNKPGIETHLQAILPNGAFELVGGVDPDGETRSRFLERTGVTSAPDLRTGLQSYRPDVVVICSPPQHHADQVVEAFDFGVSGILCEKPMAETVADCKRMLRAAEGRPLLIAHQRRYCSRHTMLKQIVDSHIFGKPLAASAWFSGEYLNNGSHAADLCRFLVGDDTPWSIQQFAEGFGVKVAMEYGYIELDSDGQLAPRYMTEMYVDFANALQRADHQVACTGEDGMEAVRAALQAEERDAA